MKRIIYSCFDQTAEDYYTYAVELDTMYKMYKSQYRIAIMTPKEVDFIGFLVSSYENAKQMPSESLFVGNFPEVTGAFANIPTLDLKDFRVYLYNFIDKRVNKNISKRIMEINQQIEQKGITDDLMKELNELHKLSNLNKSREVNIDFDFEAAYREKLQRPVGMIFNIPVLDEKIGGLAEGTMSTIAGFTSHFKSTCALNLAYYNVYNNGYNVVYVSLETPKEDVWMNLYARHSYDVKFNKYPFIPHDKMRKCQLTQDEMDYLFQVVRPDWEANAKGKLIILDESDFMTMSFGEIYSVFEQIDEKLQGYLDAFIVDYIQLFKFSDSGNTDDNKAVNAYVSFFRKLTQNFRSGTKDKKLIGVILSQINRGAWKKASKNEGKYDLTCLADANELERGSHRVLTCYTSEEMKMNKEASVQILKNRSGQTMWQPEIIYADGDAYIFGEEQDGFSAPLGGMAGQSGLGDLFDDGGLDGLI